MLIAHSSSRIDIVPIFKVLSSINRKSIFCPNLNVIYSIQRKSLQKMSAETRGNNINRGQKRSGKLQIPTETQLKDPGAYDDSVEPVSQFLLKTPKGMRDIDPVQAWRRNNIFKIITNCFESHGALPLDTPVCERREVLGGNYGEETKLIYNLEDQGGEALSLRYDLTVPFARYLGQNKILAMTRYHIAKVYRRDNPSITKGRLREFYQCDIDFAGKHDLMMADAECLEILCEILKLVKLPFDFTIKVNHRAILNGMFKYTGVPSDKFKTICSSIDKLDKMSWAEVKKEMCVDKGLDESVADKICTYVSMSGKKELIEELLNDELATDSDAKKGLEELKVMYKYTDSMGITDHLKFDMSLARGLDYYTGIIYEAVVEGDVEVGSIAAGGRYDNLVSALLGNANFQVPCVGLSIGVERLFAILESHATKGNSSDGALAEAQIHCYIGSIGKEMSTHRYKIINDLRKKGLRVKNLLKDSVKPLSLYQACERDHVPYAIFFGGQDLKTNTISLKILATREDEKVKIDELAEHLKQKLQMK